MDALAEQAIKIGYEFSPREFGLFVDLFPACRATFLPDLQEAAREVALSLCHGQL